MITLLWSSSLRPATGCLHNPGQVTQAPANPRLPAPAFCFPGWVSGTDSAHERDRSPQVSTGTKVTKPAGMRCQEQGPAPFATYD